MAVSFGHNNAAQVSMADHPSCLDADPDGRDGAVIKPWQGKPFDKTGSPKNAKVKFMTTPPTPKTIAKHDDKEEWTIVQAVLLGDLDEFQILVHRYHKPIYHLVYRALRDTMTAEDLTQEAFTRSYEKLHTFKAGKRFFPWLYTIAVNLCKDHLRRQGIHKGLFSDNADAEMWPDPKGEDCARRADCAFDVAQIAGALDQLPILYSEPMLLYYREGFTLKEISNALGISSTAVKVRIHRGRKKLMQRLGVGNEKA